MRPESSRWLIERKVEDTKWWPVMACCLRHLSWLSTVLVRNIDLHSILRSAPLPHCLTHPLTFQADNNQFCKYKVFFSCNNLCKGSPYILLQCIRYWYYRASAKGTSGSIYSTRGKGGSLKGLLKFLEGKKCNTCSLLSTYFLTSKCHNQSEFDDGAPLNLQTHSQVR